MSFWDRQATLQIGGRRYSLDELTFTFKVTFEDKPALQTAEVEVYNLSPATRESIQTGDAIIINAGYKGDVGCVFSGEVASFSHELGDVDCVTKIKAADIMEDWLSKDVNKTYKCGSTNKEILEDLLNLFGVEVSAFELVRTITYPRGKVVKGKLKDKLVELAVTDGKSRFLVRQGQIFVTAPDKGVEEGYLLSPETGLLKYNESKDGQGVNTQQDTEKKTRGEKQEEPALTKMECLLNHRINAGDKVVIQSRALNGTYLVVKGSFEGSSSGDWKTMIEGRPC